MLTYMLYQFQIGFGVVLSHGAARQRKNGQFQVLDRYSMVSRYYKQRMTIFRCPVHDTAADT
jgi:hypothetical protein